MSDVVGYDTEHDRDEGLAKDVVHTLVEAYPGYGWYVTTKGGILFIQILEWSGNWGMSINLVKFSGDVAWLRHEVLMKAGEFLERANAARGKADQEKVVMSIEGVPLKDMVR